MAAQTALHVTKPARQRASGQQLPACGRRLSMSQTHTDFMLSKVPLARFGLPQETAAMVAWLCSEDCSFSTGAVFDLSSGRATY